MPPAPAFRSIDASSMEAVMKTHREMSEAMLSAEIAAKASTDAPRKAMIATLSEHASRLGFQPLGEMPSPGEIDVSDEPRERRGGPSFSLNLSSVSKAEDDAPAKVRDENELIKKRSSTVAIALALTEEESELRLVFDSMDKDANGCVDGKEWGKAMSDPKVLETLKKFFGGKDATKEEVGRAFKLLDIDASGTIEWEELVGASKVYLAAERAAEMCMTPAGVSSLKKLFDLIDSDGDGKVDSKEWGLAVGKGATRELIKEYFGGMTTAECGRMFTKLDADGNGHLSFDEFIHATQNYNAMSRLGDLMSLEKSRKALRSLFDSLDLDGNGSISAKGGARPSQATRREWRSSSASRLMARAASISRRLGKRSRRLTSTDQRTSLGTSLRSLWRWRDAWGDACACVVDSGVFSYPQPGTEYATQRHISHNHSSRISPPHHPNPIERTVQRAITALFFSPTASPRPLPPALAHTL